MNINSIKDLIDLLKDIGEPQPGHSRFFRGHSDQEWKLEPSVYRVPKKAEGKPQEKPFIENEDNIIRDAIINSPDDFSDEDSIFSILVKLQHYGYPTRLLDLTTNALVALYFAVKSFDDKDGELFIFDIPNSEVKYFDSDTVSILSALSLRKEDFRIDGAKSFSKIHGIMSKFHKFIDLSKNYVRDENREKHICTLEFIETRIHTLTTGLVKGKLVNFSDADISSIDNEIDKYIQTLNFLDFDLSVINEIERMKYLETFNAQPEIARLLHDIRKDKPSFLPVIENKDMERVICVKPKLDNNRIIRQQGCFLLFGINTFKASKAILNEKWLKKGNDENKVIIPQGSKKDILEELKVFGISEKTLFPELESQAKEILDKYKY